ncbi:unnamed protein product [Rotaria sordida]|uniref:Uncharacterized protein n=2 Tax=Rotaria sordida TaxID=392033 RepID=A0A813RRE8_9BILA|nr:unnamed protein product [Rotaria sordida]CAF0836381.1 unnamed protein product [Rotaria sordida]
MRKNFNDLNHQQVYPDDGIIELNNIPTHTITDETPEEFLCCSSLKEVFRKKDHEHDEQKGPAELVSFLDLFRFTTRTEVFYMIIGTIAALAHGAAFPLMLLVFGNLTDIFTDRTFDLCKVNLTQYEQFCPPGVELTPDNFLNEIIKCNVTGVNGTGSPDFLGKIREQSIWLTIMGCATIVLGYFQVSFWSIACERQTRRLRETFFRSILSKEIAYFDINKTGQLSTRLTEDVNKVHDGTGDKLGSALQFFAAFLTGLILGFTRGWKLTLVILSVSPLLFASAVVLTRITATMTSQELKSYAKAGAVAEEVLSSIRTVFSYNGAAYELKRYEEHLRSAKLSGIRKGGLNGILMGIVWLLIFCVYALGFWYGAKLVREENFSIGGILIVFFSLVTAMFGLGQAAPHLQSVAQARGAAYTLWNVIDTPSKISIDGENGIQKEDLNGDIKFTNVHFAYPSRIDVPVLNGLSFTAQRGQTTALVGSSGCGKSTCIQLLQRFYDTIDGSVEIDDIQVNQYNLSWLREHIGVVSQEPILFQTTIKENILFGKTNATQDEIVTAAKMANAHDFIKELPDKYDTLVGERGAQLSGGQKQRIAIARALVRNPRILLLDEATSALDRESESIVQEALDRASKGRTTIVIAHRLSTIVNASKIIVLDKGSVIEEGNHKTLMNARSVYYGLVEAQNLRMKNNDQKELENDEDDEISIDNELNRSVLISDHNKSCHNKSIEEDQINQKGDQIDESQEYSGRSPFFAVLRMNSPEWFYIILACLACICNGGVQPIFGIILSKVIAVFEECDPHIQEKRVLIYVLFFIGIGLITLFTMFLQSFLFAISGETLTQRLRAKIFQTLLRQEITYFDRPENNTGALCTRLATEASDVQGATGIRIGTMLQNISNLGVGIILAFIYGWSLTLIMLAFVPFMIIAGFLQMYLLTGFTTKDKKVLENAGKITVESISNIRTVAQLTKEKHFGDEYCKILDVCFKNSIRRAHIFGLLFGFTDAIMFFAMAALFSFGAWRVEQGAMTFENVMLILNCILFGAMAVGQTSSMAPDYSKAISSSKNILILFQRVPKIDNCSNTGKILENFDGEIDLKDLEFYYPNRREVQVLKNFNLTIQPHKQIALVGSSGCGKSTIIQLLEHFYDPTGGQILINQNELSSLNLQWWRSQIGFVSQEPVLFNSTIRENIAYGDTTRIVSMEEIEQAAKNANIHHFITTLPKQYETNVGARGTQLSGGQKQRIAIARALIRNPKVLLLDEATSALDTENERIVQEALDEASKGRTTIVIAHRLSTIQNSDRICVVRRGHIVESGKHDELLARKGYYYRLAQAKK